MARQPLSTLPLAQFITPLSTSPSKPTPLRQSASSLMTLNSLLPSPFLASTTPRAPAGPLATIYDRSTTSRGGASPSRSRQSTSSTPSRLIDQEEQQEQLPTDEITTVTPPRRLLDLFVESASKESKSPRQRVQSTQPEESAPAWSFFFDDESEVAPHSHPSSSRPVSPEPTPIEEATEDSPEEVPYKENERLPPRQHFRSTSLLSLSLSRTESTSEPDQPTSISLPASINPSPTRPEPPRTPPPVTNHDDSLVPSPTYPTSYPPLNSNLEQEATANPFSEGLFESFESESIGRRSEAQGGQGESDMGLLDGLGIGMSTGEEPLGRGRKRLSEGTREGEEKRTKTNE